MTILSEAVKMSLDSVRQGLKVFEKGVETFEKRLLRSIESSRAWLNQARAELPGQFKGALAKISTRGDASLRFATQEDLRALMARFEEFEAKLDGSFRDTPASKKARVAAKA